jgi:hypothetical protein
MPGNLELHRPAVAAFNTRDVERFIAFCDPQIELRSAVTATVYRGHEGVREWHRDISEAFGDEVRLEPEAYFDLGKPGRRSRPFHGRREKSGIWS